MIFCHFCYKSCCWFFATIWFTGRSWRINVSFLSIFFPFFLSNFLWSDFWDRLTAVLKVMTLCPCKGCNNRIHRAMLKNKGVNFIFFFLIFFPFFLVWFFVVLMFSIWEIKISAVIVFGDSSVDADSRLLLCSFSFFFGKLSYAIFATRVVADFFLFLSCSFSFFKKNDLLSFLLQELLLIFCNNMIYRTVLKNKCVIFIYFFPFFLSNFLWSDFVWFDFWDKERKKGKWSLIGYGEWKQSEVKWY